jgi:quercetin dioxygenase-like cupin family protein
VSSTYPKGDPRAALIGASQRKQSPAVGRPATLFDLLREDPDEHLSRGGRTWIVRAQNFCVCLTDLVAGEELAPGEQADEHFIIVSNGTVEVTDGSGHTIEATAPSVCIVPAGASSLTARTDGRVVRIFPANDAALLGAARNAEAYRSPDPLVTSPGASVPTRVHGIRVYRMSDVVEDPSRLGRIMRTSALMINWFPDAIEPRDPDQLSPHSHDDFEQCTITLAGAYVHHLRTAWTPRMSQWRPDEHPRVESPSITLIPPPLIHTTQALEGDLFQLLDVFSPPREDFLAQGWVLNADDYATEGSAP